MTGKKKCPTCGNSPKFSDKDKYDPSYVVCRNCGTAYKPMQRRTSKEIKLSRTMDKLLKNETMNAEQLISEVVEAKKYNYHSYRSGSDKQQSARIKMSDGKKRANFFRKLEKDFGITQGEWFKLSSDEQSEYLDKLWTSSNS